MRTRNAPKSEGLLQCLEAVAVAVALAGAALLSSCVPVDRLSDLEFRNNSSRRVYFTLPGYRDGVSEPVAGESAQISKVFTMSGLEIDVFDADSRTLLYKHKYNKQEIWDRTKDGKIVLTYP